GLAGLDATGPEPADRSRRGGDTEHAPLAPATAEPESPPAPSALAPSALAPAAAAAPARPDPARSDPAGIDPAGPGVSGPGDVPAEWEQDWRTGEWAMPRTRQPAPPDGSAATADGAFDVFGTPAVPERDLARRSERTGRIRREPGG